MTHVMDRPSAFRTYRLSVAAAPSWCVALVVLLSFASARADTFHVDVKWEGASKGTPEAPFHTLGEGAKAFRSGNGHVIKVAAGLYKSVKAQGKEEFGAEGHDLGGKDGRWIGGYPGWNGETFEWQDAQRVVPDAQDPDPKTVTVVDLQKAQSRAFTLAAYSANTDFDGFLFRNARVDRQEYEGGALRLRGGMGPSTVQNCVFLNNHTGGAGGALSLSGRGGTSRSCVFVGNQAASGGALTVQPGNSSQTLRDFVFRGNRATGHGGAVLVPGAAVVIEQSVFEANVAGGWGGAVSGGGAVHLTQCRLLGNRAEDAAAVGRSNFTTMTTVMENCLVAGNEATGEGAWVLHGAGGHSGGSVTLRFCTVVANTASGGAVRSVCNREGAARLAVVNSIIVGDGTGAGLFANSANASVQHTNVFGFRTPYGGKAKAGEGAMAVDPAFLEPENGNYRIRPDSPCSDAAKKTDITTDIDGHPRPRNEDDPGIDLGCFEVLPVPVDTVLLLK